MNSNGYSELINSNKTILKFCWVIFIIASILGYFYYVYDNIIDYLKYEVITQTLVKKVRILTFPAVSLCVRKDSKILFQNAILRCSYGGENCDFHDFREIKVANDYNCLQFNGGKNSSGHSVQLKTAISNNKDTEFVLNLFLKAKGKKQKKLKIFIGEADVKPTRIELKSLAFGSVYLYETLKHVDKKLEKPYNDCYCDIKNNTINSTYVSEILSQNITYRRENCIASCRLNSQSDNVCLPLCPLECDSIYYEVFDQNFDNQIFFTNKELSNLTYALNSMSNSSYVTSKEFNAGLTTVSVKFKRFQTHYLTQIAKHSIAGLIANIGGLSGLFLETSLLSLFRVIHFFIDCLA